MDGDIFASIMKSTERGLAWRTRETRINARCAFKKDEKKCAEKRGDRYIRNVRVANWERARQSKYRE